MSLTPAISEILHYREFLGNIGYALAIYDTWHFQEVIPLQYFTEMPADVRKCLIIYIACLLIP